MANNLGREFATMTDDERRRFELESDVPVGDTPTELDFDNPRDEERMGAHYASLKDEVADPSNRDGMSALLDDEQHERNVRAASEEDPETPAA
ncbi:MAG: hypothetical protein M3477_02090 [Gemmatimonadota bacterium]|nr:hypothetical protein [Gemmatimonadota bacterium]